MLGKKDLKLILLLILTIVITLILSSCNFHFTITGILPTTPVDESVLVVKSEGSWIYGYIYIDGANTGVYLNSYQTKNFYNILCYQNIDVQLADGYYFSHTEYIRTKPGLNFVNFRYW
jgi:hypothetical protein